METPENKVECATLLLPANKSEAQPASPMVPRATTSITIPPVMQDILVVILFEWMRLIKITAIKWATALLLSCCQWPSEIDIQIILYWTMKIFLDFTHRGSALWVQLTSVQRLLQGPSENLYICQHYFSLSWVIKLLLSCWKWTSVMFRMCLR